MSSCRHKQDVRIISKECRFYRIIESKLLYGDKEVLKDIKANNIDACKHCVSVSDLQKCKQALKVRQKYEKELIKKYKLK